MKNLFPFPKKKKRVLSNRSVSALFSPYILYVGESASNSIMYACILNWSDNLTKGGKTNIQIIKWYYPQT